MTNDNGWRERADSHDRRLDRLTERHEALSQTVEMILQMQRKSAERHEALSQSVELIVQMQRESEVRHQKNETLMAQALEAINSLARIAQSHEHRLDDIEGRT